MSLLISMVLALFFLAFGLLLGEHSATSDVKPFECGFDQKDLIRLPFSMRFFLLAVVFLIFDMEVALLFPLLVTNVAYGVATGLFFLLILIMGLWHEWWGGALSWID